MSILFLVLGIILSTISLVLYIIYRKNLNYSLHTVSTIIMIISILLFACYFLEADKAFQKPDITYTEPASTTEFTFYQSGRPLKRTSTTKESTTSTSQFTGKVYITRKGTKYHYDIECGNNEFYECTLEQALDRGLEPCKRCVE